MKKGIINVNPMNLFYRCPRHFASKERNMVDWVKATSTKVASASLTFVTAPGYLSRTITQAFIKNDVQKWM